MKHVLFLSLLVISFSWSSAQVTNNYHNFSVNEGLPSSQIYSMTEDSYGYLWFFTDHGISRYDGYKFENFNKSDGLCDDVVFNYFRFENEIWTIGQDHKITIIEGRSPKFTTYQFNDTIIKYGKHSTKGLFIDDNKNLIINFEYSTGMLMLDKNGNVLEKPIFQNTRKTIPKVSISILKKEFSVQNTDSKTKLSSKKYTYNGYYAKIKGVSIDNENCIFIKGDSTIEILHKNQLYSIFHLNNALNIGIIDTSTYWVSYIGAGIKYFTTNGKEITHLFHNKTITNLYIDKENNKWFTTLYNGAFMLPSKQFNKIETNTNYNNISDIEFSNNKLFIGLKNGNVFELENNIYKEIHTAKLVSPIVFAKNTKNNSILFIADRTLFKFKTNKTILINDISTPYQIKFIENGKFGYSGTFGYKSFKNLTVSPHINIRRIYDFTMYKEHLYLGSYSGLYKHYDSDENKKILVSRVNRIEVINNLLFVGTHGDGISIYNDTSLVSKIGPNELNQGYVSCIKQQDANTIWVGTNTGLSRITFTDKTDFSKYIISDFNNYIPEKEITDIEILHDTLWVATNNGLYFTNLNKQKICETDSVNYNLQINYITINDKVMPIESLKNLSYDQNRLTINYKAIRFKQNHSVLYRHKLVGLESKWNYSDKQNITYASIVPGKYVFIVQVKEDNTTWTAQQEKVIIIIKDPYWKTGWFIISVISFFLILIYLFFKYRILLYNKDIVRELLRHFLKIIQQRKEKSITLKVSGAEVKIITNEILYVKSDGNYLEIHTHSQKHLTREKISNFLKLVPDPIEFMQVRRSHIVRLDKITGKGKKHIIINDIKIQVGETYLEKLKLINI